MQIVCSYQGKTVVFDCDTTAAIIGRSGLGTPVDLDLSPDQHVSHRHARVWVEDGEYWIEDLDSRGGTEVSGEKIKGRGKWRLQRGNIILIGQTKLRVEIPTPRNADDTLAPSTAPDHTGGTIIEAMDAASAPFSGAEAAKLQNAQRLALLYELPLQFGRETELGALLEKIVQRLVEVIPGATRGALLINDRTTGQLLLKAHVPRGTPAVSLSSARQAMEHREGFIWCWGPGATGSQQELHIQSSMYAPMLWKGEALGVVCVDNSESTAVFSSDDLRLLVTVAHYAAMAVAHYCAQEDLRRYAEFTGRLFSSRFPPRVRDNLIREASSGTLTIGTRQSHVTVLASDIRGFTQLTARLGPQRMSDLLNEYFPPLIETIHAQQGTIERFIGDAIFAVFGAPEPDGRQHEHAVRAALKMQEEVAALNISRAAQGAETCGVGIGIHCGEALHGFIGNAERMEFAIVGDPANFARRYCSAAETGEVLISPEVHARIFHLVSSEPATILTKHEGELSAYRIKSIK